jgi:glycerate 2-kinase
MRPARELLTSIYRDAIASLSPESAMSDALRASAGGSTVARLHLIAIGKAAGTMLRGAESWVAETKSHLIGGMCIAHDDAFPAHPGISAFIGDHPLPGQRSRRAAEGIAAYIQTVDHGDRVVVLLSGGASALIGAPVPGLSDGSYAMLVHALLGSGLNINAMNTLRRRLSRWGGGRLGAALQRRGAKVSVLVLSDVLGDSLASIGSGPCVRDAMTHGEVLDALRQAHLSDATRDLLVRALHFAELATEDEQVLKAHTPIPHTIIGSNTLALHALSNCAAAYGITSTIIREPLTDSATLCGEHVATTLLAMRDRPASSKPHLVCWGGEPLVVLPFEGNVPAGGRMQALALSAARVLDAGRDSGAGVTILAAGTDGRDGATDAAGAIVSGETWQRITRAGRSPAHDLERYESYAALSAADALIPAFVSGTNVNDVVLGLLM